MADTTLTPLQKQRRYLRQRNLRVLCVAIGVGVVSALVVVAVIYWFNEAGRFRH